MVGLELKEGKKGDCYIPSGLIMKVLFNTVHSEARRVETISFGFIISVNLIYCLTHEPINNCVSLINW